MKKIKQIIKERKAKQKEYWDNLDVDRQLKIEKIKESRSRQDKNSSKSLLYFFIAITIPLLLVPTMELMTSATTHLFNPAAIEYIENK